DSADVDTWFRSENTRAQRTIEHAVALPLMDSIPPSQRPYVRLADLYARIGKTDKAREMQQRFEELPESKTIEGRRSVQIMNGQIARAERRYDEAIREFRAAD